MKAGPISMIVIPTLIDVSVETKFMQLCHS